MVFHEGLTIKNMVRKPKARQDKEGKYMPNGASAKAGLNKSILDAGWGRFFLSLKYKSIECLQARFRRSTALHVTDLFCLR